MEKKLVDSRGKQDVDIKRNTAARVLILSSFPLIPCADLRLTLSAGLSLDAFDLPRADLIREIRSHTRRLRHAT